MIRTRIGLPFICLLAVTACDLPSDTTMPMVSVAPRHVSSLAAIEDCEYQLILDPVSCGVGGVDEPAEPTDDPSFDTWFDPDEVFDVTCPPGFPARYRSAGISSRFRGSSVLSMGPQWDETHTYRVYSYQFSGDSDDGMWRVTGIHHVADVQCAQAYWSYFSGSPARIARLHHERLYSLGRGGSETGGSGGSGGDEGGGTTCTTEYVMIEVSYDDGATWEVWWEGEATVCR